MPIYAYRCEACGFAKDVLQKMSDPQLTVCPECGKDSFKKQLTAAGFQLKGSGWYVTDFRGGTPPATGVSSPSGAIASSAPAQSAPAQAAPAKSEAPASAAKPASTTKGD